ncbi:anti-sigma factor family protein [Promicromonospora thailandica]|uniref:Zinc-finger n=1 Tax=Promicromonospora thailandica TaxID=765201 RepID=A0A9X2JXL1_9MICO|nr:zf-HC2 domain-containing protein [Promicromonospora thailandica]MCP2264274.1 putative zinc-finger [Promicromonospora thailandica]BFF21047.1 anti-sigma-L factor RslA [Promicromonospora thailandica]
MIPVADEGHGGDRYAEWDAAYVLGALSPSDRRAYERHLAECDACRSAVAELAGMPGLLSTLTAAHAEALAADLPGIDPGDGVGPAVVQADHTSDVVPLAGLAGAARRTRRRRRTLAAVAASALLAVGVAGGTLLGGPEDVPPTTAAVAEARTVQLRPVGDVDMRAELVVTPTTWGTSLRWSCHYPPAPGQEPPDRDYTPSEPITYDLVLVARDGARTVAGTWSWSGGATIGLDASSALPLTEVERVEITLDGQEEALASATL